MSKSSGYSGRALVDKLGVKASFRIKTRNAPNEYLSMLSPLPDNLYLSNRLRSNIDMWHVFTCSKRELATTLKNAQNEIAQNGMIWVSWPKKSSGMASEVTEDTIREVALALGLVDIKVCAVNDVWSALKLVIRKELRHR